MQSQQTNSKMPETKLVITLRILLVSAGIGWGISVFGVFLPWPMVVDQLTGLGAGKIPSDPMLNYWLRMTATAFTAIGIFFLILAAFPRRYAAFIPFAGIFLIVEGAVLLSYGLVLELELLPFAFDAAFCLIIGSALMVTQRKLRRARDSG
ncbi:MAG: hypothetical protein ACYS8Z_04365 [Planctomycetota bacterium]|jgi:hypothetical protein